MDTVECLVREYEIGAGRCLGGLERREGSMVGWREVKSVSHCDFVIWMHALAEGRGQGTYRGSDPFVMVVQNVVPCGGWFRVINGFGKLCDLVMKTIKGKSD